MGYDPLAPFDWSQREVLIGLLRDANQLESSRNHLFYHTPAKLLAVRPEEVRYVALYQSKRLFGGQDAGIRSYGRVDSFRRLPRGEIWEIPSGNNRDELYYRFEIEAWDTLPKTIQAVGLAPGVSMMTSLFLLTHCRRLPELFLRTRAQWDLYSALRGAAARTGRSGGSELLETQSDNTVMVAGQAIGVYRPDGRYEQYSLREFLYNPHGFMTEMLELFGGGQEE